MWLDILVRMKKESGKTIKQISEESRVPLGTLNKLFSGQTKDPKVETLRAVVYSLGYTLDDLEQKKSPGLIQEDTEELSVGEVVSAFVSAGLVPRGKDLTEEDVRFLMSIIDAVSRWFGTASGDAM